MTNEEMRELDAWLAERVFGWEKVWFRACGVRLCSGPFNSQAACQAAEKVSGTPVLRWLHKDGSTSSRHGARWSPTSNPLHFSEIKREIERRGWGWESKYLQRAPENIRYRFTVFTKNWEMDGCVNAETEELAGCLAMKAAVEVTDK